MMENSTKASSLPALIEGVEKTAKELRFQTMLLRKYMNKIKFGK